MTAHGHDPTEMKNCSINCDDVKRDEGFSPVCNRIVNAERIPWY